MPKCAPYATPSFIDFTRSHLQNKDNVNAINRFKFACRNLGKNRALHRERERDYRSHWPKSPYNKHSIDILINFVEKCELIIAHHQFFCVVSSIHYSTGFVNTIKHNSFLTCTLRSVICCVMKLLYLSNEVYILIKIHIA